MTKDMTQGLSLIHISGRVWVNGLLNALSLLIVLYLVRKDENLSLIHISGKRLAPAHGAESYHQTQRQCKQQGQSEQLTVEQKRAGKATQNHRHKNTPINPFRCV